MRNLGMHNYDLFRYINFTGQQTLLTCEPVDDFLWSGVIWTTSEFFRSIWTGICSDAYSVSSDSSSDSGQSSPMSNSEKKWHFVKIKKRNINSKIQ